jgi:hypothetical protein
MDDQPNTTPPNSPALNDAPPKNTESNTRKERILKALKNIAPWAAWLGFIAVLLAALIGILPDIISQIRDKPIKIRVLTDSVTDSPGPTKEITIPPSNTPSPIFTPTVTTTPSLEVNQKRNIRVCKPIDPSQPFSVINAYDPTGFIGDIGDITVTMAGDAIQFRYISNGLPEHEWDLKYINKVKNDQPAKFGGVLFQNPPNNSGTDPTGGYDIRQVKNAITWEARSLQGEVNVQFVIGGIDWIWNEEQKVRETPPYPDTLPRLSLGNHLLTSSWQTFSVNLAYNPDDYFGCVLGGFGWVIKWGTTHPETYEIEVRNIYYKK